MAALSNHRHERFAQHLAQGKTGDEAYQLAGYKPNRNNASRLKANESIQARVRELQDVGAQRAEVSVSEHISKLQELRDKAVEAGQWSAAIQAEQLCGKVSGHYVDRKEIDTTHHTVTDEPMQPDDWEQQYTGDARH